jgi:low temperature requirement protein LtrA
VGAEGQDIDLRLVTGALCGFAAIAGLWWVYFVGNDEEAAEAAAADQSRSGVRRRRTGAGYDLTHLLMIAGIIGTAAGIRLGLPDLLAPAELAGAWLIGAGTSIYLLATAWFRGVFQLTDVWPRVGGAALASATVPVGTAAGTGQQLAVVALVLAATAATGTRVAVVRAKRPAS